MGTQQATSEQYRDCLLSLHAHQTGSGVVRTRYAVAINDPHGNRLEYLRDFSSIAQATTAAREWIDTALDASAAAERVVSVGTIPTLPAGVAEQLAQLK